MKKASCLLCERDSDVTPLLTLEYRRSTIRICPQHLPVLIHDPGRLVGILPGAEELRPSDMKDCPGEALSLPRALRGVRLA